MDFDVWFSSSEVWMGWYGLPPGLVISHTILGPAICSLVVSLVALIIYNFKLNQEIKRRQKVSANLKASKAHYQALIAALPDLIMRINRAGIYLEFLASPNFPVLGDKPESWVGTHVADRLPPELARKRIDAIQKALSTQLIQVYEHTVSINGHLQIEQVRVVPYSADEVLMLVQNISDLKQAEERLSISEQRFRQAIEIAPFPIMIHAEDGEVLHINRTWTELTGYTQKDVPTTQSWAQLVYEDNADYILKNGIAPKYNFSTHTEDGALAIINTANDKQLIWKFSTAPLEQLPDGHQVAISIAVDITESRQTQLALKDSEERYRSIYNQAAVGLANGTLDGKFIDVNPQFCQMLGYSREELLAKSIIDITHPDDRNQFKVVTESLFLNEIPYVFHEKRYLRKDGSFFWSSTGVSIVRDAQGNSKHTLAVIQDISDRIKAEKQLKHDAFHDELTGLPNRSLLIERLELALKRTKRYPESQLAVLFLDLDNFKLVNDSLGHQVGDKLLLAISTKLKLIIRETDLAARIGGDEFVVLLEEISDLSEAVMVAERILEVLKIPVSIADRELFPGVSIGIALSSQNHHYKASELLRDADVAMYWAKHSGRGQYVIFDSNMHLQAVKRLQIENSLRNAMGNGEFLLYYQPIVNLKTQKNEAFEALLRWQHPEEGLMLPEEFIDVAKEIGLIASIDEWVLQTACQQLTRWQSLFPNCSLKVNINLLDEQLEESLLDKLEKILAVNTPVRNSLMLEITESILVQDFESTKTLLHRLQAMGVGVVIDDFGKGYSCLRYLHQLSVQGLKIDQSFINPADLNEGNQVITASIISLCKSLGLTTIAEGVNTSQQISWLNEIGCDAMQGECSARPMSVANATELLGQEDFCQLTQLSTD